MLSGCATTLSNGQIALTRLLAANMAINGAPRTPTFIEDFDTAANAMRVPKSEQRDAVVQRLSKRGTKYNVGSQKSWAAWQKPPVICPGCGKRVTLKDSFRADFWKGTFHAACLPHVRIMLDAADSA